MKIAVIGAGFFGTTAALELSKKHEVDLYEKSNSILNGASLANQLRFHLGYHYPRSPETVLEIKKNNQKFIKYFGKGIFGKTKNLYGVCSEESKTSFKSYLNFLKKNNLKYKKVVTNDFSNKIEGQILSNEKNLNYFKIKEIINNKILRSKIKIHLNSNFKKNLIEKYDKIIIATYDQNNKILKNLGFKINNNYRYELVEKIIIKLPKRYKYLSCMVIDGEFVCLDPYVGTNYHLLSDVKFSKLEINEGRFPTFKHFNKKYLNSGIVKNIKISQFKNFIKHGSIFLPFLKKAKYHGSFYVTRTIKLDKKNTDERINEINYVNKKIISILSGKWNTCLGIAEILKKDVNK